MNLKILLTIPMVISLISCNNINKEISQNGCGIMGTIPNKESIGGYENENREYIVSFDFQDIHGNTAHLSTEGSKDFEDVLKRCDYVMVEFEEVGGQFRVINTHTKFKGLPQQLITSSTSDRLDVSSLNEKTEKEYYKEGLRELKYKNIQLALENFNKAIELNDRMEIYYVGRANCRMALGEWSKAIEDCSKAIKLNSNQAIALFIRGSAKNNLKENGCQDLKKSRDLGYNLAEKAVLNIVCNHQLYKLVSANDLLKG